MATPSTMIIASLILIGEKAIGGTLTSDEQTHHLARLNGMMESWFLDRLMVYQLLQESFSLTTSQGVYTIGSSGDFNTTRPTKITDPCFIRDSGGIDYPLTLLDAAQYGAIMLKTLDGSYPRYLFYDQGFTSASLGTIKLYQEPLASLTLYINSWKQLQTFAAISTTVVLPPGYQEAIEYNYAIRAAAGQRAVPAEVRLIAVQSKAAIEAFNAPAGVLRMDAGAGGRSRASILTG